MLLIAHRRPARKWILEPRSGLGAYELVSRSDLERFRAWPFRRIGRREVHRLVRTGSLDGRGGFKGHSRFNRNSPRKGLPMEYASFTCRVNGLGIDRAPWTSQSRVVCFLLASQ